MDNRPEIQELRSALRGKVIAPDDWGYDRARAAWNKNIDQCPAVIVKPEDGEDTATAVRFAARRSMPVAVQNTGHGAMLPCDGAMLIDTAGLDGVSIDAERRIARVASGAKWEAVMKAAQRHGLAGRAGFNATIGVIGYSLGGGWGWLTRRHGLACDHVTAADLVLADGSVVRTSADENPDLLWALRGGTGDVGIVTALEFGLVPLTAAYGGRLSFPIDRARELMSLFAETTRDADARLTIAIRLSRIPSDTLIAKLLGGRPGVEVMLCFLGGEEEGQEITRRWTEAGAAHGRLDVVKTGDLGTIEGPPPKGAKSVQVGEQLARLDGDAIEALVSRFEPEDVPVFLTELRHISGASRPAGEAVFDRHQGEYLLHLEATADDKDERTAAAEWLDGTRAMIKPVLTGDVALGFTGDGDRGLSAARRAYSDASLRRWTEIKARHDPENRFRFNVGAARSR